MLLCFETLVATTSERPVSKLAFRCRGVAAAVIKHRAIIHVKSLLKIRRITYRVEKSGPIVTERKMPAFSSKNVSLEKLEDRLLTPPVQIHNRPPSRSISTILEKEDETVNRSSQTCLLSSTEHYLRSTNARNCFSSFKFTTASTPDYTCCDM